MWILVTANVKTIFWPTDCLREYLRTTKDLIGKLETNNITYKIPPQDCLNDYMGRTRRPLITQILKKSVPDVKK